MFIDVPRQKQILSLAVLLDQLHRHLFGRNGLRFADKSLERRSFFKVTSPFDDDPSGLAPN